MSFWEDIQEDIIFLFHVSESYRECLSQVALTSVVDLKKTFDNVDLTIALHELYLQKCRPSLLRFIQNFLPHHRRRVKYKNVLSDRDHITCGVPQGTRLCPAIFLVMINRLSRNTLISARFVHDLTLPNSNINIQQILDETEAKTNRHDPTPLEM